jgi:hypothetical protein
MRHIARLIVEGFDAGSQLFNGDHQGNGQYIEPPPRVEVVELPRRTILPRRRPPRSRPC